MVGTSALRDASVKAAQIVRSGSEAVSLIEDKGRGQASSPDWGLRLEPRLREEAKEQLHHCSLVPWEAPAGADLQGQEYTEVLGKGKKGGQRVRKERK